MGATGSMSAIYASMGTSAIGSIGNGISQSRAISAQGDVQQAIANSNAKISDLQARQTIEAGDVEASRLNLKTQAAIGATRARQGASGVAVNSGTNALVQNAEANAGAIDEMTIRSNAARKAWGYQTQSLQDTYQGKVASMTAKNQAEQTVLTNGLGAISGPLSIYANYSKWLRSLGGGDDKSLPFDKH